MAAKKALSKLELLQAEAVITLWARLQVFSQENYRQLAAIGLIVCVIVGGTVFWRVKQTSAERESLALLNGAMKIMAGNSENVVDREIKYKQALDWLKNISAKHSGTKAGIASIYYSGVCSYSLKKYDDAISYYEDFSKKAGGTFDYLRSRVHESLGYAYEEKGEFQRALEFFQKQKGEGQAAGNTMALLNLARCYEAMGDRVNACNFYKEFTELSPSSQFKAIASVKAADLCEKMPK